MHFTPVLAAGLETLVGVAFVVISLISWLTNYLNARAKPNGPNNRGAARPQRPRSERIQSEIEQFMREQVKRQEGEAPAAQRPKPQAQPESRQPAPARQQPQRRPQPAQRGPAPRPVARKPAEPLQRQPINQSGQQAPTVRPGEEISHRKSITSEGLGRGVRDHLKTAMVERVQAEAQVYLGANVSTEVSRHLGTFAAGSQPGSGPVAASPAQALAADLRSREGMRRALIAQTILEKPMALRRGRS
ncbi:hypothetical protein AYO47_07885 [Planctomyces sp. SCGC AG-212-M04]|nr:hypothetical protein AYO47_07885 [Planctomyces sp. SCGC AG-212-M04]